MGRMRDSHSSFDDLPGTPMSDRQHVRENCDATLKEIRAFLPAEHGLEVSLGCLWNTLTPP